MAEAAMTDQQMALVLQATRDFAFEQLARDGRLIPFGVRVKPDGEIEFARFAGADTDQPLAEVQRRTGQELASEAAGGGIIAGAVVAAVALDPGADGFTHAICVHLEAPGFSRRVLAPYALDHAARASGQPALKLGPLVPADAAPVVFAG